MYPTFLQMISFIAAIIFVIEIASAGLYNDTEIINIVHLNDKNFDEIVLKSDDIWIVEFFTDWCG